MAKQDPKVPLRADHRYIKGLLTSVMGGKVESVPAEYDLLTRVFRRAGGSWVGIFQGSPDQVELLKQVIKRAYEKGYLTRKYKWHG